MKTSILFDQEEPLGWVGRMVEYEILGVVHFGRAGSYHEPPDTDEVEIQEVFRFEDDHQTKAQVAEKDWPFDSTTLGKIEDKLVAQAHEEWDAGDNYPDYEDDDYDY